ncbi:unnamed protein product [Protopolystoma xenopodis]|uniref:Uncharacterized protein n=1 Tax=Protopolystoma xenopodis TaxID=117903 RepID=A0A3S5A6Z0_9PLAT|nr:unnamed protein product [Protopolystoma xenopodis]
MVVPAGMGLSQDVATSKPGLIGFEASLSQALGESQVKGFTEPSHFTPVQLGKALGVDGSSADLFAPLHRATAVVVAAAASAAAAAAAATTSTTTKTTTMSTTTKTTTTVSKASSSLQDLVGLSIGRPDASVGSKFDGLSVLFAAASSPHHLQQDQQHQPHHSHQSHQHQQRLMFQSLGPLAESGNLDMSRSTSTPIQLEVTGSSLGLDSYQEQKETSEKIHKEHEEEQEEMEQQEEGQENEEAERRGARFMSEAVSSQSPLFRPAHLPASMSTILVPNKLLLSVSGLAGDSRRVSASPPPSALASPSAPLSASLASDVAGWSSHRSSGARSQAGLMLAQAPVSPIFACPGFEPTGRPAGGWLDDDASVATATATANVSEAQSLHEEITLPVTSTTTTPIMVVVGPSPAEEDAYRMDEDGGLSGDEACCQLGLANAADSDGVNLSSDSARRKQRDDAKVGSLVFPFSSHHKVA